MPNQAINPFNIYRTTIEGQPCYVAGLPGYPRNFSRDVLTAGIMALDNDLLTTQLALSSLYQGTKNDIYTGEEPGKIHHEYPGVSVGGNKNLWATYNACDTTALYLIAVEVLSNIQQTHARHSRGGGNQSVDPRSGALTLPVEDDVKKGLRFKYRHNIQAATKYILAHVQNNIFYEFPPPGAQHFALKSTYWKDSITLVDDDNQPLAYPIVYTLAHFQAARGLAAAARLTRDDNLQNVAQTMFATGIKKLITPQRFVVAASTDATETGASSDELHTLAYIPKVFAVQLPLHQIAARAAALETAAGFACVPQTAAAHLIDTYHGYVVWPYEQAMIHYGASKFGLQPQAKVAQRVKPFIKSGQELLDIEPHIKPRGNPSQLWSAAAMQYFSKSPVSLLRDLWL